MQINKLQSILRNPIGIESAIMKEARLTAANMIEGLIPIPAIKPSFETKNDYIADLNKAKSCCSNQFIPGTGNSYNPPKVPNTYEEEYKTQACLSDAVPITIPDFHDPHDSAPKNNIIEAKPSMAELPLDLLTDLLCPAYQEGCIKYYRNSWRKGFKLSIMFSACLRHLTKFYFSRETYDTETLIKYGIKKHHLGAAIFCIISMYNDHKNHPHNDDRRKL